jgi:hypothetical protein
MVEVCQCIFESASGWISIPFLVYICNRPPIVYICYVIRVHNIVYGYGMMRYTRLD